MLNNIMDKIICLLDGFNNTIYRVVDGVGYTMEGYDSKYYTLKEYKGADNAFYGTKAYDNEARRLQVMSYSTVIDGELGEALDVINRSIDWVKHYEESFQLTGNLLQYSKIRRLLTDFVLQDKVRSKVNNADIKKLLQMKN